MTKTLGNIIIGTLAAGTLLIVGCQDKEKIRQAREIMFGKIHSEIEKISQEKLAERTVKRSLEDYFFNKYELGQITSEKEIDPTGTGYTKYPNPIIFRKDPENPTLIDSYVQGPNNQHEGGQGEEIILDPNRILKVGLARYWIQGESNSESRNLFFEIVEFESEKHRKEFMGLTEWYLADKMAFARDNTMLVVVEPTMQEFESFSNKQKVAYKSLIQDYIKRVGVIPVLSEDSAEQEIFLKSIGITKKETLERVSRAEEDSSYAAEEKDSSSYRKEDAEDNKSKYSDKLKKESAIHRGKKSLEKYLFQGEELKFLWLNEGNIGGTDYPNPSVLSVRDLNEEEREQLEKENVLGAGLAEYQMSDVEGYSKIEDIALNILEFKSKRDRDAYIEKKDLPCPLILKDNFLALIEPNIDTVNSEEFSEAQKVIYINLIKDYSERIKAELLLSRDREENQEFLKNVDRYVETYYLKNRIKP